MIQKITTTTSYPSAHDMVTVTVVDIRIGGDAGSVDTISVG